MKQLRNKKILAIKAEATLVCLLQELREGREPILEGNAALLAKIEKVNYILRWLEPDQFKAQNLWNQFKCTIRSQNQVNVPMKGKLPKWLFCDGCDLSYIYHHLLGMEVKKEERKKLTGKEVLFFALAGLIESDLISL